jgi:competence protein ComEC
MTRRVLVALLALASLSACRRTVEAPGAGQPGLRTTFFDVGQGDAALLQADGAAVLIDTGPGGAIARLLRSQGVKRIDLLILSHPHLDHAGGVGALLDAVPVAEIWHSGELRGKLRTFAGANAKAEAVAAGRKRSFGRLSLAVLHPQPDAATGQAGGAAVNNESLVVQAIHEDRRLLFPGDCELGCWEQLFRLHRSELRSDILKAAHHGSWNGTNSGVLINVRPSTVIVSCGRDNEYGHPHRTVLSMISKLGAKVLRTDESGTIRCEGIECRADR